MLEALLCQLHVRFDKLDFPVWQSMKVWKSNRGPDSNFCKRVREGDRSACSETAGIFVTKLQLKLVLAFTRPPFLLELRSIAHSRWQLWAQRG